MFRRQAYRPNIKHAFHSFVRAFDAIFERSSKISSTFQVLDTIWSAAVEC